MKRIQKALSILALAVLTGCGHFVPLEKHSANDWPQLRVVEHDENLMTVISVRSLLPSTRRYMLEYWAFGFPPSHLGPRVEIFWLWERIRSLFASGSGVQAGLAYP